MRGGGRGIRASVNHHVFIECDIMRGGGRGVDAKIGSKATVLTVDSWEPDQDDVAIPHGHSVLINVSAANSSELEVLYDEGTDFDTGTHSDTETIGDELNLVTSPYTEDWEGVTPLNNWTQRFTTGTFSIIDDGSGSNNVLKGTASNNQGCRTADDGPNVSDAITKVKYQFKNTLKTAGIAGRITGSGSACRGYILIATYADSYIRLQRLTGDGSAFNIVSHNYGTSHSIDTWYWLAYRVIGDDHYCKWWADSGSEPGSWTWIANDSTHDGPGDFGVVFDASVGAEAYWWDDFLSESVPPAYVTSGNWESGDIDVSSVDHMSAAPVTWDETTPTDTTVAVKARWPGGSWVACTNGSVVPDIDYEQDMRAGATKDTLEFRVELSTTDTSSTPAVSNLRAYFEPGRLEDFEIIAHGVSCVPPTGLEVWGRRQVSLGSELDDWDDLWAQTVLWWMAYSGQTVTATFRYWGNTIDSITFSVDEDHFRCGDARSYFTFPQAVFETGPTNAYWVVLEEWTPLGHAYQWHITDSAIAIHADAYWICGHYAFIDHVGSMLVATPSFTDHIGSMLVKGWQIDDHVGSALVQGWRIDDVPGSMLVGQQYFNDHPGSVLIGAYHMQDHPGSMLVYGVNRDGAIFVNVIDDDTYQALIDEGITFG